jgi:hypothetical protein
VYLGLTSTALGPFFIAGPLLAGVLSPIIGFTTVFVAAAVLAAIGAALCLRVREPRHRSETLERVDEVSP